MIMIMVIILWMPINEINEQEKELDVGRIRWAFKKDMTNRIKDMLQSEQVGLVKLCLGTINSSCIVCTANLIRRRLLGLIRICNVHCLTLNSI